jgi:hypothetical protein
MLELRAWTASLLRSSVGFVRPTTRGLSWPPVEDLSPGVSDAVGGAMLGCGLCEDPSAGASKWRLAVAVWRPRLFVGLRGFKIGWNFLRKGFEALNEMRGTRVVFTVLAALTTCDSLPLAEMCAVRVLILGLKNFARTTTSLNLAVVENDLAALVFKGVCLQRNIYGLFGSFALKMEIDDFARAKDSLGIESPTKPQPSHTTSYHSDNHSPSF